MGSVAENVKLTEIKPLLIRNPVIREQLRFASFLIESRCSSSATSGALPVVEPVQLLQLLQGGRGVAQAPVQLEDQVSARILPRLPQTPNPEQDERREKRTRRRQSGVKTIQMYLHIFHIVPVLLQLDIEPNIYYIDFVCKSRCSECL